MVNYQQGKIYKIVCHTTGLVYYGSTCEPTLARRLSGHKDSFKLGSKISSTKIIENGNYGIYLVEYYPCNNKDELRMRERFYIENNECVNNYIPIRSKEEKPLLKKEHRDKNKTTIQEYKRIYKAEHKIEIAEYNKKYQEKNKEYWNEYRKQEKVKVKMGEADKRYREANKEKISKKNKRQKERIKIKNFFLNFLKCFNV